MSGGGVLGGTRGGGGGRTVHGKFRWKVQEQEGSGSTRPGPARQGPGPEPRAAARVVCSMSLSSLGVLHPEVFPPYCLLRMCARVCSRCVASVVSDSLLPRGLQPSRLHCL